MTWWQSLTSTAVGALIGGLAVLAAEVIRWRSSQTAQRDAERREWVLELSAELSTFSSSVMRWSRDGDRTAKAAAMAQTFTLYQRVALIGDPELARHVTEALDALADLVGLMQPEVDDGLRVAHKAMDGIKRCAAVASGAPPLAELG